MSVQDVHPSTHVTGTINVVGTATCDIIMTEIYVKVTLQRADGATWPGASKDWLNVSQLQGNAASPCSAGPATFRGYMSYTLTAPAGYNPSYSTGTTYGIWQSKGCGTATKVSPLTSGSDSKLTVTVPIYKNN